MGYVAIKGGGQAIEGTKTAFDHLRTKQADLSEPLDHDSIQHQLRLLHSRVISDGLLAPSFMPDCRARSRIAILIALTSL